jgi:ABC-type multidrug transport system fused ATPase/permease subunit
MAAGSGGVWGNLQRRIIVISTMERSVRITFMSGAALVVLAVIVNIFHGRFGPDVATPAGTVPLGVLALLAIGEFAASYVVALALVLIGGRSRLIVHGVMLLLVVAFSAMSNFDLLSFAVLLPMGMVWAFGYLRERQQWSDREAMLAALSISLAGLLVIIFYLAMGHDLLIMSLLALQALLAMLGLCLAATDIAEIAVVTVEGIAAKAAGIIRRVWLAALFALATTSVNLLLPLRNSADYGYMLGGGLGLALWLGMIFWMVISRRKRLATVHPHISYRTLFLVVGFYFIALQAGILVRFLSDPLTYSAKNLFSYPQAFMFVVYGFLGFVVLFFILGRRTERLFVSLAYGASIGMFIFHYYAGKGSNIELMPVAVGMLSLLLMILAPLSRKMRADFRALCLIIADLNLAFAAYAFLAELFLSLGEHGHGGALTVGQALVVLAALAWDIVYSGEAITNKHSEAFPRLARVAMFMAYVMSVALLVMVSTAAHLVNPVTGEAIKGFDSEGLVGAGLVLYGAPFVFVMAMLRIRNLLAAADACAPQVAPPALGSEELPGPEGDPALSPAG